MEVEKVRLLKTLKFVADNGKRQTLPAGTTLFPPIPQAVMGEVSLKRGTVQVFPKREAGEGERKKGEIDTSDGIVAPIARRKK